MVPWGCSVHSSLHTTQAQRELMRSQLQLSSQSSLLDQLYSWSGKLECSTALLNNWKWTSPIVVHVALLNVSARQRPTIGKSKGWDVSVPQLHFESTTDSTFKGFIPYACRMNISVRYLQYGFVKVAAMVVFYIRYLGFTIVMAKINWEVVRL